MTLCVITFVVVSISKAVCSWFANEMLLNPHKYQDFLNTRKNSCVFNINELL